LYLALVLYQIQQNQAGIYTLAEFQSIQFEVRTKNLLFYNNYNEINSILFLEPRHYNETLQRYGSFMLC